MIIAQREQLLQAFGSIATSAANAATEGIAEAAKTDSKTVETALKLFGGFDRSEFENIGAAIPDDGMPNLLVPAVRPPASYEGPSEYFKPLSNTVEGQNLLVPAKDLQQQLEDPRFRMSDGLSGFSDNRITKSLVQKEMIINTKPGGGVSLGRLEENGIIIVGGKPADPADMAASMDSFGKLYRMENTVGNQLKLHEQLDLGAFGRASAPRQTMLPTANSPKLNQGLKGMPDVQAAIPQDPSMRNLALDHALKGTPQSVEEMVQMANVLQAEIGKLYPQIVFPPGKDFLELAYQKLSSLKDACKLFSPNTPPNQLLLEAFEGARFLLQQYNFFPK